MNHGKRLAAFYISDMNFIHGADGLGEDGPYVVDAGSMSVDFWFDMKTLRTWYPNKITFGRGAFGNTEFRTRRLRLFSDSADETRRVDIESRLLAQLGYTSVCRFSLIVD